MIAKHFSAISFCPRAAFTLGDSPEMVCHCMVVETKHGLVLVDTGLFAEDDWKQMRAPRPFLSFMRPVDGSADGGTPRKRNASREATAARQLEQLGYRTTDVRHVVCTHLDVDHAGGISDFPQAELHVMAAERAAVEARRTMNERRRYVPAHFAHGPKWRTHEPDGETWKGFAAVRALATDEPDVLLVPLEGHTRGHAAVAVRTGAGWLLHCGDAYFHHAEMSEKKRAPFGLEVFQKFIAVDDVARRRNQERLRELKAGHGDVRIFCAHSKHELANMQKEGERT